VTPIRHFTGALAAQRGHLFLWIPVAFALGIGIYLGARAVPTPQIYAAAIAVLLVLLGSLLVFGENWRPIGAVLAIIIIGGPLAALRANLIAEPVLSYRYYGPIQGRIVKIDRSASDVVRLTLDKVVLSNMSPWLTPALVRVSLHGQQGFFDPEPGLTVMMTGHLSAPSGPVEPGGFDFQRCAWFRQLGAVGYTRIPALALLPAEDGAAGLFLHR
jgi:competence protein ComEC